MQLSSPDLLPLTALPLWTQVVVWSLATLYAQHHPSLLPKWKSRIDKPQLVMHVLDPPKVIIEMRAIAIPGGFVSLQESDAGMFTWYPENPGIASWSKAYPLLAGARGADPLAGRKLVSYALAAGFRRDDIVASLGDWIASTPQQREEFAGITIDMIRSLEQKGGILEKAGIDSETKEVIVDGLEQWARAKGAWLALPSPVVVCVKH